MSESTHRPWDAIEAEYKAGVLSLGEICRQYNVSRSDLNTKAQKDGWTRDLFTQVQTEVHERMLTADPLGPAIDLVEKAALRSVEVLVSHRKLTSDARALLSKLFEMVVQLSEGDLDLPRDPESGLIALDLSKTEDLEKLRDFTRGQILLGKNQGLAGVMDQLLSALTRVVTLERGMFSLAPPMAPNSPIPIGGTGDGSGGVVSFYLPSNGRDAAPSE